LKSRDPAGLFQGRWTVFSLASLLFILSQFYRVSNAIIAPDLQKDLELSAEELGLLSAAFFYAFALVQVPLGIALDRLGGRRTMTLLSLIGAGGALLFAAAHSFAAAFAGRALLGLGMAGNLMGSMKLLTRWFSPREFATLSGLMLAMGTLGNMLAATPLAAAKEWIGWRESFGMLGLFTAAVAVCFFALVREGPSGEDQPGASGFAPGPAWKEALKTLCRNANYWIISLGTFFRYGTFVAIQGLWIGPYMIQQLHMSPIAAGNLLLLLNTGLILGSPLGGWLSDRVLRSRKKVIVLGLAMMALVLAALGAGWGETGAAALAVLLFSFGLFGSFGIVMYAHIKELMPSEMSGTALTGINLFTMLGGAAMLQGLGWVLDHVVAAGGRTAPDYHPAFLLCAGGVALALVGYLFATDTRP
jgi:sugar phosphate permease